jgi:hypothetical protein
MARKEKKYHYIYKITCLINNRYYIGMHSTHNVNDDYMGGGKRIKNSIKKHGKESHIREILEFFDNREDLKNREKQLVNEELLNDPMCMNINLGGEGGWLPEWQTKGAISSNQKNWKDPIYAKKMKEVSSEVMKKLWQDPESSKRLLEGAGKSFKGKKHTEEAKKTIGDKISKAQKAEKNSQFGTCWINNPIEKTNRRIKKEEIKKYLQEGWESGMKMDLFKR